MKTFKADLHIHTVLSPCGDVEMSPVNIVKKACEMGLDIIGITDHNSTLNCKVVQEIGLKNDLFVLMGVEINTKEEIHCLAFFKNNEALSEFQKYLNAHLANIPNDVQKFGYQLVVNENEEVLEEIEPLLITAINQNINEVAQKVHQLNGVFIPAHIDKYRNSIISQLGFIPQDLEIDAIEISQNHQKNPNIKTLLNNISKPIITSSDAHYINQIGSVFSIFKMKEKSFSEIRKAFKNIDGRTIESI